jgi:hypothetical protein
MFDFGYGGTSHFQPTHTYGRVRGQAVTQGVAYPSPFFDLAHTYLPPTVKQMFKWCRYYYLTQPLIAAIVNKMAEYPVTDLVIDTDNKGLRNLWERFFEADVQLRPRLIDIGLYYMCYGNAIASLMHPFVKWLKCKYCGHSVMAKKATYRFRTYEFHMTCDKCNQTGHALVEDQYLQTSGGTRIILWNPEDIDIVFNPITQETMYFYSLPIQTLNDMAVGRREVIEQLPQVFIDAAKKRKSITLNKDNLFHIKRPSVLSGPRDTGWGTPLVLPVLKDVFYLQIMKKAQEAILLERIVPLTVIFPQQASGTADPYTSVNLIDWKDHIAQEIQRWRLDRNYIPILPLPIGNQVIGGDGRALLMSQEIKLWSDQIVAGMGVPNEFIFGGLQWSGSNVSLRMLENQFMRYLSGLLLFIKDFLIKGMAAHMGWPTVGVRFKPFKMADDLQRKAFLFQLNQAGKVSDTTLINDADLNPDEENDLLRKETKARLESVKAQQIAEAEIAGEAGVIQAKYQAKAQTIMSQEQQQAAAGSQGTAPGEPGEEVGSQATPPPAGAQQGPGGQPQQDPMQQIVQRLRALSPEAQRTVLMRIEQSNPDLANQLRAQFREGGGVDASPNSAGKPLPTQLPPRRGTESAMI